MTVAIDLHWIPLGAGAGGGLVRWSGRIYELVDSHLAHRPRCYLYHSALTVTIAEATTVIEMAPVWTRRGDRGVVAEGPVGARLLGRSRCFRYEVRRWSHGSIPDVAAEIGDPVRIGSSIEVAERILEVVPAFPTLVWGRDELDTGDMWNSNSLISWLLVRAGMDPADTGPPRGGRAPGWDAGVIAASRDQVGSSADQEPSTFTGPSV